MRWRDAPQEYGPAKTLYNRWKRWSDKGVFALMSDKGVFALMMDGLSAEGRRAQDVHDRCDLSQSAPHGIQPGVKRGSGSADRAHEGWHEHEATCCDGCHWPSGQLLYHGGPGQRLYQRCSLADARNSEDTILISIPARVSVPGAALPAYGRSAVPGSPHASVPRGRSVRSPR